RKGDYAKALEALNQKLELAKQNGSQPLIADCYGEIAAVVFDQENYPAALEHYDNALKIYEAVGNKLRTVYNQANRGNILWRLGRYADARQTLAEVTSKANESKNDFKQLFPVLHLIDADIRLRERR